LKILVADDDTSSRLVLGATLKKLGHQVTAVADGRQAWEAWQRDEYALFISDWMMPDLDGLELCRLIRAEPRQHYTYIILLTALGGRGRYLEGMGAGADDFITKPFDEEQLATRLHVAARILQLHERLRAQAMHDGLTGLWNRTAVMDWLQQELARAEREGSRVGLILVDLDRFKLINDSHGHLAGDAVLQEAARRMRDSLRPYDKIGRYGGEEFLIVAPGDGPAQVQALAERIRDCIGANPLPTGAGELGVTASLGVAVSALGRREAADTLIAAADAALYRAKRGGRNRVEFSAREDRDRLEC